MILPVIVTGLAIAGSTFSFGTEVEPKRAGVTVRAGAFFPVNNGIRNNISKVWPTAGIEYEFASSGKKGASEGLGYSISADIAGTNRNAANWALNSNVYIVPVLANVVYRTNGLVLSAGIGANFASGYVADNFGQGFNARRSTTTLGYQASIGYEFNTEKTPFGLECRFLGSSNTARNAVCANAFVRF